MPEGFGEYIWVDGSAYKGHYNSDKKNGYGVYTWDNSWKYKGNFDNDFRNGYGQLFDS